MHLWNLSLETPRCDWVFRGCLFLNLSALQLSRCRRSAAAGAGNKCFTQYVRGIESELIHLVPVRNLVSQVQRPSRTKNAQSRLEKGRKRKASRMLGGMRRPTGSGGGGAGGGGSGEFSIMFVNGPIKFQSEEGVLYARLFHIVRRSDRRRGSCCPRGTCAGKAPLTHRPLDEQVDTDGDGYVGGAEGASFIRRARLMNDANREVRTCRARLVYRLEVTRRLTDRSADLAARERRQVSAEAEQGLLVRGHEARGPGSEHRQVPDAEPVRRRLAPAPRLPARLPA